MKYILDNYRFIVPSSDNEKWTTKFKEFKIRITPTTKKGEINREVAEILVKAFKEIEHVYLKNEN